MLVGSMPDTLASSTANKQLDVHTITMKHCIFNFVGVGDGWEGGWMAEL